MVDYEKFLTFMEETVEDTLADFTDSIRGSYPHEEDLEKLVAQALIELAARASKEVFLFDDGRLASHVGDMVMGRMTNILLKMVEDAEPHLKLVHST